MPRTYTSGKSQIKCSFLSLRRSHCNPAEESQQKPQFLNTSRRLFFNLYPPLPLSARTSPPAPYGVGGNENMYTHTALRALVLWTTMTTVLAWKSVKNILQPQFH